MPAPHQWLVNPQAIEVWAHTTPALCSEPKCYLVLSSQVAFPRQAPVLFCSRHTKLTIRRAIGQIADLGKMLAATAERDGQVLRREPARTSTGPRTPGWTTRWRRLGT